MNRPSWPSRPTARPPCWLISDVSSWLSSPSAISTTVSVRSSVMRTPRWRRLANAHLLHQLVDAPAAAVHDDGLHADEAQQRDVAREAGLERGVGHRIAAEADHQRLARERADVGQRLGERARLEIGGDGRGHRRPRASRKRKWLSSAARARRRRPAASFTVDVEAKQCAISGGDGRTNEASVRHLRTRRQDERSVSAPSPDATTCHCRGNAAAPWRRCGTSTRNSVRKQTPMQSASLLRERCDHAQSRDHAAGTTRALVPLPST